MDTISDGGHDHGQSGGGVGVQAGLEVAEDGLEAAEDSMEAVDVADASEGSID